MNHSLGVPPRLTFSRGFTLTELAIVLLVVALLLGGMMLPLTAQDEIRRTQETQRLLANAREALLGFAVANGRFPCPAVLAGNGLENFAAGGSQANGNCSNFYDGFLPAAQLGLGPTNTNGLLLDDWGQPIRYAVWSGTINGVSNPLTRTDGVKSATMTATGAATLLSVCASSSGITAASCGTASALTATAPVVVFSLGKDGATGAAGADETANIDDDVVFVSHESAPASAAGGEFDDLLIWLSPNILFNRMVSAGKLP